MKETNAKEQLECKVLICNDEDSSFSNSTIVDEQKPEIY